MKLHKLNMTAFGPFAGKVEISFDDLDQGAPFLLAGPTGSGKTTILDAVCFALYGRIPRAGTAVPDVASRFPNAEPEPSVEVVLTVGGERLKVRRTPSHRRAKRRGEGETTAPATGQLWKLTGDEAETIASKPSDVDRELGKRLHMTAEQFSQVVMLPQGDFSKFLKADAHERRALLERLFPGENLAGVQAWLEDEAAAARTARDDKRREIEDAITAAWSVVSEVWANREEGPPEAPGPLDPDQLIETVGETAAVLEADRERTAACSKKASEEWRKADQACSKAKERRRLVEQRGKEEDRREELVSEAGKIDEVRSTVETGTRAAVVHPLAEAAARRTEAAESARAERDEFLAGLDREAEVGSLDPEDLADRQRELRQQETTLRNFEDTELPKRRRFEVRIGQLRSLQDELGTPGSPALADLEKSVKREEASQTTLEEARRRRLHIRECRNAGMAAELATKLADGQPCVVCGSTQHPSPAEATPGQDLFEKSDEDAAEEAVGTAEADLQSAQAELAGLRAEIEKRKTEAASELNTVESELADLTRKEDTLLEGSATIGARRELVGLLADRIETALKAIEAESIALKERDDSGREAARSASENGFADLDAAVAARVDADQLELLRNRVLKFDQDLATVNNRLEEGELKGIDRSEAVPVEDAEKELEIREHVRDEALAAATTCENRYSAFTTNTERLGELLAELEPLTAHHSLVSGLAAAAVGKNAKKIQLCNFVLAARLKQVIAAANVKLGPMSGDRYALQYEESAEGRGPAGLGIRIFDAHVSQDRSTKTLSGGETFYCSLALALGLAEVVQMEAGGRSLETLFIDEGFGTLDSETLNQVMNQIENLRANGRSVGLVSHVEEMKTRISAQIQVKPSRNGSKVELIGV